MESTIGYWGYIGIMENTKETIIGFRVQSLGSAMVFV